MIGNVRVYKPEMKIKHYEEYRAVYCSLCRVLGKRYGLIARLTLSYDFTFFAVLRMCIQENRPCFEQKRCPFNPAKKCNFCNKNGEALEYAADIAMLIIYYKILDNLSDEGFFKKLLMYLILPVFRMYHRKATRYAPEADRVLSDMMKKQRETEESKTGKIDLAADASAEALGKLAAMYLSGNEERILYRVGYLLGRWVYIADAFFDREEDGKKGRYNPLNIEEKSDSEIKAILNVTVGEMISAYELLNVRQFDEIIRNVLVDGLHFSAENRGGRKNEKSV